MDGMVIQ